MKKKLYISLERQRKEVRKILFICWLTSQNACNSRGCARQKPGVGSLTWAAESLVLEPWLTASQGAH